MIDVDRPSVDVVIVGGGIIGTSAAAMLAERGASVTLVEATAIGAGASGRNLGVLQHPFDPVLADLYHDSLAQYRRLAAEDAGFALPDRPAGLLLLNPDPEAARRNVARLAAVVPDLDPTYLEPDAVARLEPSLSPGWAACRLETGHPIPPASATDAWRRRAERAGVAVRIGTAAEPRVEDGRAQGVRLADGSRLAAAQVLVAIGPWSPVLLAPLGQALPITRTWGVTVELRLGGATPRHVVEEDHVDAVNRPTAAAAEAATATAADPPSIFTIATAGGAAVLGSTFLPAEPDRAAVARLLIARGTRFLPAIGSAEVVDIRVCARPQSADGRPFIGPVPGVEGLFVCAGHGPWGVSTGPGSAAVVVAAMVDRAEVPAALALARAVGG